VHVDPERRTGDTTGPDGEFFLNAEPGLYFVHADDGELQSALSGPIELDRTGANATLDLELLPAGAVAGRVRVATGARAGGRTLALSRGDAHFETTVTEPDGSFRFDGIPAGSWQIAAVDPRELERAARAPTWIMTEAEPPWDLSVVAGETTRFDLALEERVACRLEGRFLVDGAPPIAWTWGVMGERYAQRFDSDGGFSFELEEPGTYELSLGAPRTPGALGGLTAELELLPGENRFDARIETGTLELTRLDAPALEDLDPNGQIDAAYTLLAELSNGLTWYGMIAAAEDGKARLARLPSGHIRIYRGQYARRIDGPEPVPMRAIELAAGETKTVALE
jgi:hypothetical protein